MIHLFTKGGRGVKFSYHLYVLYYRYSLFSLPNLFPRKPSGERKLGERASGEEERKEKRGECVRLRERENEKEDWQNAHFNHLMLRKSKKLDDKSQDFLFPPLLLSPPQNQGFIPRRWYANRNSTEKLAGKVAFPSVVEVTFRRVCDGWFPRVGILRAGAESNWLSTRKRICVYRQKKKKFERQFPRNG